jgi:DNA-binding NtrC family response regulator
MMLIVHMEDEGPLREIMQIVLSTAEPSLKLQQFSDSDSAIEYIKEHLNEIALFLLDVRVPGAFDGMQVATKIRELGSARPIVITSAYRRPKKLELDELKADWMAKPWHIVDAPQKLLPLAKAK